MSEITYKDVYQQILELPQETLVDIAKYVEFVRFKVRESKAEAEVEQPLRIVNLEGRWKDTTFRPNSSLKHVGRCGGIFPETSNLASLSQSDETLRRRYA